MLFPLLTVVAGYLQTLISGLIITDNVLEDAKILGALGSGVHDKGH